MARVTISTAVGKKGDPVENRDPLLGVDEDGITGGDTGAEGGGRFFGEERKGCIGGSDVILCVVFGSSTPFPIIGRRPSRMALRISTALNLQYALYRFEKEMKTLVKDMMNIYIYIYIYIYIHVLVLSISAPFVQSRRQLRLQTDRVFRRNWWHCKIFWPCSYRLCLRNIMIWLRA